MAVISALKFPIFQPITIKITNGAAVISKLGGRNFFSPNKQQLSLLCEAVVYAF